MSTSTFQDAWDTLSIIDQALVSKNAETLQQLLSVDFTGVIPTGATMGKEAYIGHHCNSPFGLVELTEENIENATIRKVGDTVIINRKVGAKLRLPTGMTAYEVQRTEILVASEGKWLLAGGQGTKVGG